VAAYTQQGPGGQAPKSLLFGGFGPVASPAYVDARNNRSDCGSWSNRLIVARILSNKPLMTRLGHVFSGPNATRKWVAALALLAFFLQSLAIQTHVHQSLQADAKAVSQHLPGSQPLKGQDPVDQCRLCQELIHAGNFVTPSAVVALASLNFAAATFAALAPSSERSAKAFAWHSRAPPRR